jgi:hypothetical protein
MKTAITFPRRLSTLVALAVSFASAVPVAAQAPVPATQPPAVVSSSGQVAFSRGDLRCRIPGSAETRPLGAVLAGPETETRVQAAVGLNSIVSAGTGGIVLTAATRAFSAGNLRGSEDDVLLVSLAANLAPRWATIVGGPGIDRPLSLARAADGSLGVVGTTRDAASLFGLGKEPPDSVLIARFAVDGSLSWFRSFVPGELVIANPIVALPSGDWLVGGAIWRDGRYPGFLMRLDGRGNVRWARAIGPDHEMGITWTVAKDDGAVMAVGPRQRIGRPGVSVSQLNFDIWLGEFDAGGRPAWAMSYTLDSGVSMAMVAPLGQRPGWLVMRESRYDRSYDRSRLPLFEVDAQGAVRWAIELEIDGDATVSSMLPAQRGGMMLFGYASPKEGSGGFLAIEIGPEGELRSSTWVDVLAALTTPQRMAVEGRTLISALREADGSYVLLSDYLAAPPDLVRKFERHRPPLFGAREAIKVGVYIVRADASGQVPGCSSPLGAAARPLALKAEPLELVITDLSTDIGRELPANRQRVQRLQPPPEGSR